MGRQSEPKGHRLILNIDRDSHVAIQKTEYKIFTGLSQETVQILKDPEAQKKESTPNTESSDSISELEGEGTPADSE
jgi:hypothetical protein